MLTIKLLFILVLILLSTVISEAKTPSGDWPMTGGNSLRSGRTAIRGSIKKNPSVLWQHDIGAKAGSTFTADLDGDGYSEQYSIENWCLVRRDADDKVRWRSESICRSASLIAFDDLDGDGAKEPLMQGAGLNSMSPLYFIFDPATGKIRWRVELNPSNGGDLRFGKIDKNRKGLQLLRSLFPNPGGGELHLFCWDKGIENGYDLWSWQRADDFIYFPQLAVGDMNNDGQNEVLMLSHMCVRMFEMTKGIEISRIEWGKRSRSYGNFGIYQMKPGPLPSVCIASMYNKVTVIDTDGKNLVLRWDHEFEPGGEDTTLQGKLEYLQDSPADLDGDGWSEVTVNYYDGLGDHKWRTAILGAKDGNVAAELVGKVLVGAADVNGDGKTELFLRNRINKHDPDSGPVTMASWDPAHGLTSVWISPVEGEIMREPNDPSLNLSRHPNQGTRLKLADGSRPGSKVFFIKAADGSVTSFEQATDGVVAPVSAAAPTDLPQPLSGYAAQSASQDPPLVVDFDNDGVNEVVASSGNRNYLVIKPSGKSTKVIKTLHGLTIPPVFADINGDGKCETIAVKLGPSLDDPAKVQPCVEVNSASGKLIWKRSWPKDFASKNTPNEFGFNITFAAVGHFTNKKTMDIAVSYTGERTGGHTAVLNGATGETIWDIGTLYEGMYGSCWDAHPPVVFDFDGDGLDDIATTCQTVHYTVLRGKDGAQLVKPARDVSSQSLSGSEPPLFPDGWTVAPRLSGVDADGDGKIEIGVMQSQAAIGAVRANGESIWFLNLPVVNQLQDRGCWTNIDGTGKLQMAFAFKDGFIRAYNIKTGAVVLEENLGALGALTVADVDGDGLDELLFSSEKGILYCLGKTADPITGSHIKWVHKFPGAPGQAIFADVNGDGRGEILVPCSDDKLYCLGPK